MCPGVLTASDPSPGFHCATSPSADRTCGPRPLRLGMAEILPLGHVTAAAIVQSHAPASVPLGTTTLFVSTTASATVCRKVSACLILPLIVWPAAVGTAVVVV